MAACGFPSALGGQDFAGGRPTKGPLRVGSGTGYTPLAPLALTAASELTEDYFAFQTHQIDPAKDTVIAYSRADGEVEAMLLQDGSIKQVYRDATQPGGWNIYTVPDAVGVVDMVAGISRARAYDSASKPGPAVLKVFYRTSSSPAVLNVAVRAGSPAPGFSTTQVPWGSDAGPLQVTVGFDDSLLVTAMAQSSSLTATDATLHLYTDTHWGVQDGPVYGTLSGFAYNTGSISGSLPPHWSAALVEQLGANRAQVQLALPNGTFAPFKVLGFTLNPPVNLWLCELTTNRPSRAAVTSAGTSIGFPAAPTSTTTGYSVEHANPLGSNNIGAMIVRTLDSAGGTSTQRLWVVSPSAGNGGAVRWTWTELLLPADPAKDSTVRISTGVSPLPASEKNVQEDSAKQFMDVFVVADGSLSVIRQAPQGDAVLDYTNPVYTPAIPLETGVAVMTSQANSSTGDELLVVGQDGALQYLVKDPVTGVWTDNPVHLPASDVEETSTYRVSIGVVDAWQMPVAGQQLQITADSPATALVNGTGVVLGDTAVSVTTNDDGEVVVALLAEGLAAPALTVSGAGLPTTTINPSAAVNGYLRGGSSLGYLSPLTADTLAAAKASDGTPVAPGASDKAAASAQLGTIAKATTEAAERSGGATLSSRRVRVHHRRDGLLHSRTKSQLTGVRSDISVWAHDALHAIKKGAVAVKDVTYDAANDVFIIAGDFVHWADGVLTVAVKTLEDAAHVVYACLVKLGADIKKAVEWVRAEVVDTLRDADALGEQYLAWLYDCCGFVAGLAQHESTTINAWLTARQASIKADLLKVAHGYATSTTLATMAENPPAGVSATSSRTRSTGLGSKADLTDPLHGRWLLSKIENEIFGELQLPLINDLLTRMSSAVSSVDAALEAAAAAFADYLKFLLTAITRPDKAMTLGVHDLLLATVDLVDAAFDLARGLCTALLGVVAEIAKNIPDILKTPTNSTPLVGGLLKRIGKPDNTTVGKHLARSFAFPAVVAYKAAHGGQGRPFGGSTVSRGRLGSGDVDSDLKVCAGTAVAVWALADAKAQFKTAFHLPSGVLATAIDIAAPFIVGLLTVPSTKGGEPYFTPPVTNDQADTDNFIAWLMSMAPGVWTAMGYYCEKTGEKDPDLPAQKRVGLFATFVSGVISLAYGCAGNKASSDPTGTAYALAVLLNMAYIVTPCLDDKAVEASEGTSALVAAVLTAATGITGGGVYA